MEVEHYKIHHNCNFHHLANVMVKIVWVSITEWFHLQTIRSYHNGQVMLWITLLQNPTYSYKKILSTMGISLRYNSCKIIISSSRIKKIILKLDWFFVMVYLNKLIILTICHYFAMVQVTTLTIWLSTELILSQSFFTTWWCHYLLIKLHLLWK
mgnify:CR=1 FL=1